MFLSEKDGINKDFFFLILCTYFCALAILTHDFSGGNYLETSTQRNESHCLSKKSEKSLSFLNKNIKHEKSLSQKLTKKDVKKTH